MAGFVRIGATTGCSIPSLPFDIIINATRKHLAGRLPEATIVKIFAPLDEGAFDLVVLHELDRADLALFSAAAARALAELQASPNLGDQQQRAIQTYWPELLGKLAAEEAARDDPH